MLRLAVSVLFGVVISAWPHFVQFAMNGHFVWIADTDELDLYLMTASQAFFNHLLVLSDPLFESVKPTVYPWIQLVPGIVATKLSGLGPMEIGFFWRIIAGATMGAGWYLLYAVALPGYWAPLIASIFTMSDAGIFYAKPVLLHLTHVSNDQTLSHPTIQTLWRIISPGLSLAFLLIYFRELILARKSQRVVRAGITLGLLFYVYFYYWTAALLGLGLCCLFDRQFKTTYLKIAAVGIAIGIPKIIGDFLIQKASAPDWAIRSDKFLPIGHFDELMISKGAVALFVVVAVFAWRVRQDLKPVLLSAVAGFLLVNNQIVTGLQIENFHWLYFYGPALSFLAIVGFCCLASYRVSSKQLLLATGTVFVLLISLSGLWLRQIECFHSKMPQQIAKARAEFLEQRTGSSALESNKVVAGDAWFVSFSSLGENLRPLSGYSAVLSPSLSIPEWHEREALNAFLEGLTRDEFEERQLDSLANPGWGPWGRSREVQRATIDERLTIYDQIVLNPGVLIKKFSVRYFAVKSGFETQPILATLSREIQSGPHWRIFEVHQ